MKDPLINEPKIENSQQIPDNITIQNINYSIFFLIILAISYSYLFITMAMNTNSMNNNLNKIIDVIDMINFDNINTTSLEPIHTNLSLITDCVLHRYCKKVPS